MDNVTENVVDSKGLLHYKEKTWSNWIKEVTESRVYRLPYHDMNLYGVQPEVDVFSAVICSTCGTVVKAPALKRHIELRHPEETQSFVVPKQVPVKKSRPNILRKPSKSPVPVENAVSCTTTNAQVTSAENNAAVQSIIATEASAVTCNTKNPSLLVKSSDSMEGTVTRRKSPTHNERKRTREKDREREGGDSDRDRTSSQESSSTSARTTPKQLQSKRNNNNSNSEKGTVRSSSSNSTNSVKSKQTNNDKYAKKSSNVTVWGGEEEQQTKSFQVIYSSASTVPSATSVTTNVYVLPNGQQTSSVRCSSDSSFTDKSFPSLAANATNAPSNNNEWPKNNHLEKMLFSETDMGDSMPSLAPSEVPEPPPELLPTSQVLNECTDSPDSLDPLDSPIFDVDKFINSINPFNKDPTLMFKVIPQVTPSFPVKVSNSNPVLILSPKDPPLPAVNLNVNSESTKTVITKQMIYSSNPASILKPQSIKVPITVQMPLQEKMTNITFYKRYPKPITLSNFSGKKVGGALIFNSKRVNVIRNDFKTVLSKKGRSINTVTVKACQPSVAGSTVYTAKPLGPNNNCRFPKTISVIPNLNANALLTHRPNILRASLPKHGGQHVPKILASGLKRVATSSQQNDCKHLLLTQGSVNGQCFLGKMIVHPRTHETSEHNATDATTHVLDKVVPVNIK